MPFNCISLSWMPFWTMYFKYWFYKAKAILSAGSFYNRFQSTADVHGEVLTIQFLPKLSLLNEVFSSPPPPPSSRHHSRTANSCFSSGQPPNRCLRRVNGFLISLVNTAFPLVSLPQPAVPTSPRRKLGSEHQTFPLRGHWSGLSRALWRVSFLILSCLVG